MKCKVKECNNLAKYKEKQLCSKHYARLSRYGRLNLIRRENGEGNINKHGYVDIRVNGERKYEHIYKAELALGKPLPAGAIVHHWDKNRTNNQNNNLLVCPDEKYHRLIHQRMDAMDNCGNPNYRKCQHCQQYDDPANLKIKGNGHYPRHKECERRYARERYHA